MRPRYTPPHGLRARYVHKNEPCRCSLCKQGNREYIARYRARQAEASRHRHTD